MIKKSDGKNRPRAAPSRIMRSEEKNQFDVIVIGGGPAGLICAARCGELGLSACLLEKNDRPGKKLLISGSGRCNITHAGDRDSFPAHYGGKSAFVKPALFNFTGFDLVSFFRARGLDTVERDDGKIFPETESASDVLRVLLSECKARGVLIRTGEAASGISVRDGSSRFSANTARGDLYASALVIATGGRSYPATGSTGDGYSFAESLGHMVIEPAPGLTPVIVRGYGFADCAGISLVGVPVSRHRRGAKPLHTRGDVLFTHRGLSGPGILDFSRDLAAGDTISLAVLPFASKEDFEKSLIEALRANGRRSLKNCLLDYGLPERLTERILASGGIDGGTRSSEVDRATRRRVADAFMDLRVTVDRLGGYNEAMVTRGGVSLEEVNRNTMESRIVKGLYFAGEVLDVDGDTGGYNLQWAFSSGRLAAESIAHGA